MKVETNGNWTGLVHWSEYHRIVDYFSSPDAWQIGFDIVFRMILFTDDTRLVDKFRTVFKESFGLSTAHYEVTDQGHGSVFWRVYWDREAFDLTTLDKCEQALNDVAEANETRVVVLDTVVIPRSLKHIAELVQFNGEPAKKCLKYEDLTPAQQKQAKAAIAKAYNEWFDAKVSVHLTQKLGFEMTSGLKEAITGVASVADTTAQLVGNYPWGEAGLPPFELLSETLLLGVDKIETPDPKHIAGGEVKQYVSAFRPVQLTTKKDKSGKYRIHDGRHRLMAWKSAGYTVVPVVFVKPTPKE